MTLFNIANVLIDQNEISNHNITGLVCFNSFLTFDRLSTFINNHGIYGGGIVSYDSSLLLLKQHANISFVYNQANKSGGGIFVLQVGLDESTDCFFEVILYHSYYNSSAMLYFIKTKALISGDVLYGGNIDNCFNEADFETLFLLFYTGR